MATYSYAITDTGRTQKTQSWELHAGGCTHIRRGMKQKIHGYAAKDDKNFSPEKRAELITKLWIDSELREMGYTTNDVQVMSCSMNPPVKA